ncbi:MAG: glycoside hydrolase family 13 protein [Eubacterium sp.]|nr:glycoside hydrolase family 13 protein [Eubacterium sp.]
MTVFNSRKTEYKDKVRAIATNERVKLRIIVPRSMSCNGATLAVRKEGEDTAYYSMFWAGMCGDDNEYWELHFSATTSGLYWYHFELDTPWGKSFIRNEGHGIGDFAPDGADFQQTVYDEGFTTPDWLKGGIIYQIFPDRFYNSGTPKKGVRETRVMRKWGEEPFWREEQMNGIWNNDYFGGDLKGIEEKLPYLADLCVSCIYLNPIFEANSNHRYDTADYEKIDPLLGTEEDFKSLCKKAKEEYGISIILDGVFSHTGCDSKYFNLYNNYDSVGAYNSKESPYYSWYKFTDYPDEYKSWWGIKLLPEIVEENESYREYICGKNGIVRKWLSLGARGWRLDVADELPDVFLDDLRKAVKDEKPDALVLGEVWEDATTKEAYGERRRYLLGSQLDSVMNYPFADAILNFITYKNADAFLDSVMSIIENYPPQALNVLMNHIGTHDTERALTRLAGPDPEGYGRQWQYKHNKLPVYDYYKGISLMKLASLLQFTLPGVPSIYYGDETGMQGMKDPFNRECMNWDNPNKELFKWYKRLGEVRRGCKVFEKGEFVPVYCNFSTIAFKRIDDNSEVLVAINLDDETVSLELEAEYENSYTLLGNQPINNVLYLEPNRYSVITIVK